MIKLFKNLTKKDILLMLIIFVLIFAQVWLELKMPDYMSEITVLVQTKGSAMKDILVNGGYMLLCAFGSLISAVITGYLIATVASRFSMIIRGKIFNKIEDLSLETVKKYSTSSLITRTTNDVMHVEGFLGMGLQLLIKSPITAIWAITKISTKSWQFSTVTALAVVILLSVLITTFSIVVPKFKIIQKLIDKINKVTRENLTGIKVIRAFNAEKYQEEKFEEVNADLTKKLLFNQKTFSIMSPAMYLVMHLLTLSIYLIGANLIDKANIFDKVEIFGDMIVFSSYAMQIIMSFLMLAMIFMMMPRAQVSAKRINEVLDEEITIKDGKGLKAKETGLIEFKNVSFKYPDAEEYVLKDISFKVNKGETVAFIGSTGSGKSTLINLIPRFYEATEGEVLVDNINVKDYKLKELNNKIGYVSQKAIMFNGTVKSNIDFGSSNRKITDKEIKEAIEISQAKEFVEKMEDKYNSHIAQSGSNISGGQKQRLSIARAIAKNPEIYIFDDSFSALDYKTDYTLRKNIKKHTKDATTLIVAQRIGTIIHADKIIVLKDGESVGIGTHKELLKTCDEYKQIAYSQLTKEELENE